MSTSEPIKMRAQVAVAVRAGDREAERHWRSRLEEAKIAKAIEDALATDTPPSAEGRARLAAMLTGGGN